MELWAIAGILIVVVIYHFSIQLSDDSRFSWIRQYWRTFGNSKSWSTRCSILVGWKMGNSPCE